MLQTKLKFYLILDEINALYIYANIKFPLQLFINFSCYFRDVEVDAECEDRRYKVTGYR